jgi:hypothetical protein
LTPAVIDYALLTMFGQGRWATWERTIRAFARSLKVPPVVVLVRHVNRLMSAYIGGFPEDLEHAMLVDLDVNAPLPSFREAVDNLRRATEQTPWFRENGTIQ